MKKNMIKSMKLYNNVYRIFNELKYIGKYKSKYLKVKDLTNFDQLHYNGTKAIDFAIKKLKIKSNTLVLEVGSGIGGPARYISYKTKALVTALELQADQHNVAKKLTKKCKLSNSINHISGDFLNYNFKKNKFDIIVSWLTLYHIKKRKKLLDKCYNLINNNGFFFAEDIIVERKLNNKDLKELSKELYANYLPTYKKYLIDLKKAGFKIIYHKNMSINWSKFVSERKNLYNKNIKRNIKVHGEKTYDNVSYFYNIVDKYFSEKKIGGIKVIAKKIKN